MNEQTKMLVNLNSAAVEVHINYIDVLTRRIRLLVTNKRPLDAAVLLQKKEIVFKNLSDVESGLEVLEKMLTVGEKESSDATK
jgi:hypothetical protein